ncbi:MAG: hypothetical protein KDJ35_01535 [Alphaproteobacteria bacterium]|nr:hypothetical protein [Alphaproteobacteria bacterium]
MSSIKTIVRKHIDSLCKTGLFVASLLLVSISVNAASIPIADSPCDQEYYKSMKSRAWLEAQREITQNQNLIFKPDSVLEYTCFSGQLAQLARNAPLLFSENPRWGLNVGDMAGALNNLVYSATASYLTANFSSPSANLLGGRADGLTAPMVPNLAQPYSCDIMNQVWMEAKCMDFINNPDHDGFFTFEEYASSGDHRYLPAQCTGVGTGWQSNLAKALGTPAETDWVEDTVIPYVEPLQPDFCGNISDGGSGLTKPLLTGLMVRSGSGAAPVPEKVCVPAGCHYDYGSGSCVSN